MTFSLSTLRTAAERRLPGYLDAALAIGTPLDDDRYEFTSDQMTSLAKYRKPMGLGDAVKTMIHAVVDMTPLSQEVKTKVKKCTKCGKRAARWNEIIPNIGLKQD